MYSRQLLIDSFDSLRFLMAKMTFLVLEYVKLKTVLFNDFNQFSHYAFLLSPVISYVTWVFGEYFHVKLMFLFISYEK